MLAEAPRTKDRSERRNLIDDPAYRDGLAKMRALMERYSMALPHSFGEFTAGR